MSPTTVSYPYTDGVKKLEKWFETDFEEEVVMKIKGSFPADSESIRLLGIGTGNGKMDLRMLDKFLRHFNKIHYTTVEPDTPAFDDFRKTVEKSPTLSNVVFDWRNTTIEEYWKNFENSTSFEFISMVHVAYYLEDVGKTMDKLLDSLTEGGVSLLVHKSGKSKTSEFIRQLPWMSKASHMSPGGCIREAAHRANQHRLRIIPCPATVDITSVFDEESDVGPRLMDFLTQGAYFCKTAPDDVVKVCKDILSSLTTKSDDGERIMINNDYEVITIWKSKLS